MPLDTVPASDLFSANQLASDINKRGKHALSCPDTDTILAQLQQILKPQDVEAILTHGGFDDLHNRLLKQLNTGKAA